MAGSQRCGEPGEIDLQRRRDPENRAGVGGIDAAPQEGVGEPLHLHGVASAQFYGFNYTGVGDILPTHTLFSLGGVPYRLKSLLTE